jgi:Acyl-coenzyme A synthetases/AMP-(fatty) acid ligases
MDSKEYQLKKYLPKIKFDSYEDFKQNYRVTIPDHFNFAFDIIDDWAENFPEKKALLHCDDEMNLTEYTFSEIKQMSARTANFLKAKGIQKGDAVLLTLKQRAEAWVCFLALHKIGAICIPATYQLTVKDVVYRCNAANVKMIITVDDEELLANHITAKPDCTALENIAVVGRTIPCGCIDFKKETELQSSDFPRPQGKDAINNHDTMLIYFSSGTTGMPKMIVHDFTYPLGHIVTAKYWQRVEDAKLHLTMSDSGWAKFAWGKIYGQWICGAVIVAYDTEKFHPDKLLEFIDTIKLTTFCAPPTIFRFLIKEDLKKHDFSSIKNCFIAGEPLNPEVFNQFKRETGLELREGFGQSESSVLLANFEWLAVKPGSTGKPSPLYDIDIIDENGDSCEDGVVGTIVVKNTVSAHPVGLFFEYYNDNEANTRAFDGETYSTGDTAWRDADGYFWFVGRNDDVIKCSGYRIGPFEVESALLTHPSVLECAVTAAPDPVRGQVVKATIVLAKTFAASAELKKELQEHVKHTTAPYKYPRVIDFVAELPKTLGGKIKRGEIRKKDHE